MGSLGMQWVNHLSIVSVQLSEELGLGKRKSIIFERWK